MSSTHQKWNHLTITTSKQITALFIHTTLQPTYSWLTTTPNSSNAIKQPIELNNTMYDLLIILCRRCGQLEKFLGRGSIESRMPWLWCKHVSARVCGGALLRKGTVFCFFLVSWDGSRICHQETTSFLVVFDALGTCGVSSPGADGSINWTSSSYWWSVGAVTAKTGGVSSAAPAITASTIALSWSMYQAHTRKRNPPMMPTKGLMNKDLWRAMKSRFSSFGRLFWMAVDICPTKYELPASPKGWLVSIWRASAVDLRVGTVT